MTLSTALEQGERLLQQQNISAPRLTAEVLLLHAIAAERSVLRAHPERELSDLQQLHYARYLHERLAGMPTQYVTGHREFWGLDILVNPTVLIPRPETEHVVERALSLATEYRHTRIADCGTGSGCIALALAHDLAHDLPAAHLYATDISRPALETAAGNARRLNLPVSFVACDLLTCFSDAAIDLVVSNPPYVALADRDGLAREVRDHEPAGALFAGEDGTSVYRRLIPEAARVLRPGGWAVVELGYNVAVTVRQLFSTPLWHSLATGPDLAGIERVMYARRS